MHCGVDLGVGAGSRRSYGGNLSSSRGETRVAAIDDALGLLLLLRLLGLRTVSLHSRMRSLKPYLMPTPERLEAVKERDILPKVGVQPQARRNGEVGDAEQDDPEDRHQEEQAQKPHESPTQVVDTDTELQRPERVQHNNEDEQQRESGIQLALDLAALPQPGVVHVLLGLLLLLDGDGPLALDALRLLPVLARLRLDLADAQGEHAQG